MSASIPFTKMVAAGNDFIIIDARRLPSAPWNRVSRALCDRHQGIGADGLLVLERSAKANVRMRVFNPDGSEASMCGNGARCVALYLKRRHVTIETKAGVLSGTVQQDRVAMRLTDPTHIRTVSLRVNGHAVDAISLNTGVPHAVVPVSRLDRVAVNELGRTLRFHRAFAPQGTNVDFIQPSTSAKRLRLRTYERGVEAETLACGTGVAASAVAYVLGNGVGHHQQRHRVIVQTRSGERMGVSFTVVPARRGLAVTDLVLEGRARRICEGIVNWLPRRVV
jgi:diaminopimelate epimerase